MFEISVDVKIAMIRLCEFFRDAIEKPEGYSTEDIFKVFKGLCKKRDLKEARKRLNIKSSQSEGIWYWSWENEKSPEDVIELIKEEMRQEC